MLELNRTAVEEAALTTPPRSRSGTAASFFSRLNLVDRLTLGYLALTGLLIAVTPHDIKRRGVLLAAHAGLALMVFFLARCRESKAKNPVARTLVFLSHWYSIALAGFFFEEIHTLVHAVFPRWFDAPLIRLDYAMFGAHPTVWFERHASYWLTEVMNFAYFSYWPLVPGVALALWLAERKRERRVQFETFTLSLCLAYFLCYAVFILFPVEGPYHTLRHLQQIHEMPGWIFTAAVEWVEKHGRIRGGAFPSAHVAGSVVALVAAFRWSKKLGLALAPLVLGVMVSAVYGRYHYAADIWAGALVGAVGCWLGERLMRRETAR
jgi:membrane-associated phospholipid phosphatase